MCDINQTCYDAAKRFVQTAVVIDDEAKYGNEASPVVVPLLARPVDGLTTVPGPNIPVPDNTIIQDDSEQGPFDIPPVVEGYADMKITCSVQRPRIDSPQQKASVIEWALNCAEHTDITIIDWRLLKSDKHLAEDIIIGILKRDQEVGGRVRLLCIYTTQPNLSNVLRDVKQRIEAELKLSVSGSVRDLAITVDNKSRIIILNKNLSDSPAATTWSVSFKELPERTVKEYSLLACGLVPSAAMHSIAAVRERTHSLLALMNSRLDGAFCTHRALIPNVDDANGFLLNLIAKEAAAIILSDRLASEAISWPRINKWLDTIPKSNTKYPLDKERLRECLKCGGTDLESIQKERAKGWLNSEHKGGVGLLNSKEEKISMEIAAGYVENGAYNNIHRCEPPSPKSPGRFAELFYNTPAEAKEACDELARLDSTIKDDNNLRGALLSNTFLTLGTVLKVDHEDLDYYLCLQPPCDSVRLNEKTDFIFMGLHKGSSGKADIVIKLSDGSHIPLCVKPQSKKVIFSTLSFRPSKGVDRVLVNKLTRKYKWIAELRQEKALSIAQSVFSNAARIGYDEFEVLRRIVSGQ